MGAKQLLAIDDEPVILDAIKRVAGSEGWQVTTTSDARKGLELALKHNYDLCLCDIKLPDMDGFEFLQQLSQAGSPLPVIMITGYATVENAVKSLDLGAIDYLPKPFTADELLSALYRGDRYVQVIKEYQEQQSNPCSLIVPCPPQCRKLGYSSWCFIDHDGSVKVGLTFLFLKIIGSIRKINLLPLESEINQGFSCAEIEAENGLLHPVITPLSGQIIRRNEEVAQNPLIIEKDPYFKGWLYIIVPQNLNYEINHLMVCNQ
ncbi:response regulator [Caldithrix abyssi]